MLNSGRSLFHDRVPRLFRSFFTRIYPDLPGFTRINPDMVGSKQGRRDEGGGRKRERTREEGVVHGFLGVFLSGISGK